LANFEQAHIAAELDEKRPENDWEMITLSPLRFAIKRNDALLNHRHLSFGQRRLLAFLHYHDSNPSLIIADELVNGMHHEWISECLKLMRDSQAFLSSQNPLLFDFMTFESAEEVANRFIICELDEQHRFVWRNMSEPDAHEFYELHKAGLQHASEILRTRGYW
jgi:ABC-type multidrug transport system ATPase subunit